MDASGPVLTPLPYHSELRDYLKTTERELWNWFASAQAKSDYTENLRLELLKATYRLDPQTHAALYSAIEEVKKSLGLDIPVTIYQSNHNPDLNASLYYIPGEGHVVLSGNVISLLNPAEMKSLLGHELAHYVLWQEDGGELLVADRLLQTIAHDHRAQPAHYQSARWFQLYTEIYSDRGSFLATGDLQSVVSCLIKMQTGLQEVSAAHYIQQAEEIFEKSKVKTEQLSHPEAFIRARALSLWSSGALEAANQLRDMIEGSASLEEADVLGQARLTDFTRRFLEQLLRPKWFQTEATLGHAKMFFEDFQPADRLDDSFLETARPSDSKLRDYLCFLLLDFVTADPSLEKMPLIAALEWSDRLDIQTPFTKLVTKELKLKTPELNKLKAEAPQLLAQAEVGG